MSRFFMNLVEIRKAMQDSLPDNEKIEFFIESVYADGRRATIAITEKHLLIRFRGFLKRKYTFYPMHEFRDISIEESFLFSTVNFVLGNGKILRIEKLEKAESRIITGFIRKIIVKAEAKTMVMGKTCPYCSENVKSTATVCPHCQRDL
jgi:hypothetical protein